MSISAFSQLNEQEIAQLTDAPAQITLLIAGADQEINTKETDWGSKVVHFRTFSSEPLLFHYYEAVEVGFEKRLNDLVAKHQANMENLIDDLSASLEQLNPILAKVEGDYAAALVKSWRSLAKKVAEADGGLLGFGSVNRKEAKLIELAMING